MKRMWAAAGMVFVAVIALAGRGVRKPQPALVAGAALAGWEREYAADPSEARLLALGRAYLDAQAEGMASALCEQALRAQRQAGQVPSQALLELAATAEYRMGRTSRALPLQREALSRCWQREPLACAAQQQRATVLLALLEAGIEDAPAFPERTAEVFARHNRFVGLDTVPTAH